MQCRAKVHKLQFHSETFSRIALAKYADSSTTSSLACGSVLLWRVQMKHHRSKYRLSVSCQLQQRQRERCVEDEEGVQHCSTVVGDGIRKASHMLMHIRWHHPNVQITRTRKRWSVFCFFRFYIIGDDFQFYCLLWPIAFWEIIIIQMCLRCSVFLAIYEEFTKVVSG